MAREFPLGRNTEATIRASDRLLETVQPAPRLFKGPVPRQSPRVDNFRLPRNRHQLIGSCVGESGAAAAETTVQTPNPFDGNSKPSGLSIAFSPLAIYFDARQETAKYDRSILRGEGAIVTDGLKAAVERGFVPYDAWPATTQAYQTYYQVERSGRLPDAARSARRHKAIGEARRLTDSDQVLEYIAGGYSVWIGVPWRGGFNTRQAADGRHWFDWNQGQVGGHAVELLAYDLDRDEIAVGNSWMGDGRSAGFGDTKGVGWCRWSHLARDLSAASLRNGVSEALVFTEVEGEWEPKFKRIDWLGVL